MGRTDALRKLARIKMQEIERLKPRPKPKEGEWVRLKTLEEVCELSGVEYWEDVYDPEIAEEMLHLFGTDVEVVGSGGSRNFKAYDTNKRYTTWYFNTKWIVDNAFEAEGLSDDLFEI